jgi:hypothetical protein
MNFLNSILLILKTSKNHSILEFLIFDEISPTQNKMLPKI